VNRSSRRPAARRAALGAAWALALGALLGGCASADSAEGNDVFEHGLKQAEGGDVEGAIRTLGGGVSQYPDHTRMRFELARLQYETGEAWHVRERQAIRAAARFAEDGKRDEASANRREANEMRAKATPNYQAARDNLRVVVDDESDEHRTAWAYFLLCRVDVFFEDWEAAVHDMDKAIELGKPTGQQLAQMREYQQGLKDKLGR
jgi:hypothetical protein